jgi:hypothetical protein
VQVVQVVLCSRAKRTKKAIDDIFRLNRVYQYNLFADTGISSFDERTIVEIDFKCIDTLYYG